jgi:glycosyltransferase involved in cell wall biosynthesis
MTTPRVSVLLTTYNRERFLAASLESVLGQTFGDFELVISDDCSTDGTLDIVRSYEKRDPRIVVSVNDRNIGQFPNRNRAADLARAPLVKYHDSDDLMYPHCLAVMVNMLEAEPLAGFGLSGGHAWFGGPCPMLLTPRMAYQREYLGAGLFYCGPSGAIFRTDVFRSLGGFVDHGVPSDYLFWLRACARVNIVLLPADLFWYRTHAAQEFQSPQASRQYAAIAREAWLALDRPECPLTADERAQAKRNRAYHLASRTWHDLTRGRWFRAARRVRDSGLTLRDWIGHLRAPRRHDMAGTPFDAEGEFIIPRWIR